jgi:hypothetical protein
LDRKGTESKAIKGLVKRLYFLDSGAAREEGAEGRGGGRKTKLISHHHYRFIYQKVGPKSKKICRVCLLGLPLCTSYTALLGAPHSLKSKTVRQAKKIRRNLKNYKDDWGRGGAKAEQKEKGAGSVTAKCF